MHREGTLTGADGVLLSWQAWLPTGAGEARVVLLHGGADHGGRYPHLVSQLVGRGVEVQGLDLRGHGRSGGRRGTVSHFSDYVEDLGSFLQVIADARAAAPTFLVGYSLGGLIAATYALDHQDELAGIVLIGPAFAAGEQLWATRFTAARVLARAYRVDPLV
ncbi:MAG: alpha/beta hydrolase, partial [Solirubrobacteraceae bacterium]